MNEIKYFTEQGLQNLKDELNHLKNVERPNITKEISEARDKGDLSENALNRVKNAIEVIDKYLGKDD